MYNPFFDSSHSMLVGTVSHVPQLETMHTDSLSSTPDHGKSRWSAPQICGLWSFYFLIGRVQCESLTEHFHSSPHVVDSTNMPALIFAWTFKRPPDSQFLLDFRELMWRAVPGFLSLRHVSGALDVSAQKDRVLLFFFFSLCRLGARKVLF